MAVERGTDVRERNTAAAQSREVWWGVSREVERGNRETDRDGTLWW